MNVRRRPASAATAIMVELFVRRGARIGETEPHGDGALVQPIPDASRHLLDLGLGTLRRSVRHGGEKTRRGPRAPPCNGNVRDADAVVAALSSFALQDTRRPRRPFPSRDRDRSSYGLAPCSRSSHPSTSSRLAAGTSARTIRIFSTPLVRDELRTCGIRSSRVRTLELPLSARRATHSAS